MTVRPVLEEPEVVLIRWGIMQQNLQGYRLVGIHAATGRARITSPLVAFEGLSLTAETESGRIYRLRGPADDQAAAQMIHEHIRRSGLTISDVALATVSEVAMSFAPKSQAGWH